MKVKCPKCQHKDSIVKIEYGYPGHEMFEKYEKGNKTMDTYSYC